MQDCRISYAVFTPNIATFVGDNADQTNFKSTIQEQLLRTVENHDEWLRLEQIDRNRKNRTTVALFNNGTPTDAPIFPTIANAVAWLSKGRNERLFVMSSNLSYKEDLNVPLLNDNVHVQVLVTGSVYLVGGFLRILEPPSD